MSIVIKLTKLCLVTLLGMGSVVNILQANNPDADTGTAVVVQQPENPDEQRIEAICNVIGIANSTPAGGKAILLNALPIVMHTPDYRRKIDAQQTVDGKWNAILNAMALYVTQNYAASKIHFELAYPSQTIKPELQSHASDNQNRHQQAIEREVQEKQDKQQKQQPIIPQHPPQAQIPQMRRSPLEFQFRRQTTPSFFSRLSFFSNTQNSSLRPGIPAQMPRMWAKAKPPTVPPSFSVPLSEQLSSASKCRIRIENIWVSMQFPELFQRTHKTPQQ